MNRGNWILTFSGIQFFIEDPKPSEIAIEDIAHALANICRFGGHSRTFYSVAQHSVLVSMLVPKDIRLKALLHDAHEAYIGDVVRPLKQLLSDKYGALSDNIQAVIDEKFGIIPGYDPIVKLADEQMLHHERRELMPEQLSAWTVEIEGGDKELPDILITPWAPIYAEKAFMDTFKILAWG